MSEQRTTEQRFYIQDGSPPHGPFKVWDRSEDIQMCKCWSLRNAQRIARALEGHELDRSGAYAPEATCKHGVHPYDCNEGCDPNRMWP